ncbi:MAG TPA: HAMP domain-containing sensor histidine kinase [Gemmatimonadaceae bacterium]|jgi:signal transduction histidine kinase|nr:HAMP domain-containing sensor histidine kinase [Gemmatimonadaceae bacterium]
MYSAEFEVLVAANRGIVFSTVSRALLHELRTPTQALALAGEMIARDGAVLTEPVRQALGSHARQLRPLLDLVSRAQQRPTDNEPEPVALRDLVDLLQTTHRGLPDAGTFDASSLARPDLPAVKANGPVLSHVILNLVLNAVEAEAQAIKLTAEPRGTTVDIAIEDDGPGIAPSMRHRLFEPFATTKQAPVAGLGLAVARYLVTPWGGTLVHHVHHASHGAAFVLTLDAW